MEPWSRSLVNFRGSILQVVPTATIPPCQSPQDSRACLCTGPEAPAQLPWCRLGRFLLPALLRRSVLRPLRGIALVTAAFSRERGTEEARLLFSLHDDNSSSSSSSDTLPRERLWVRGDGVEAPSPAGGAVLPGVRSGGDVLKRKKEKRSVASE